jgi:hypothetical protein
MPDGFLFDSLIRHIGQTVTIFTESGGLSGSGFTGLLASVTDRTVRLITDIGAPPACPVGSSCTGSSPCGDGGWGNGYGNGYGYSNGYGYGYGYSNGWGNGYGGWGNSCGCGCCSGGGFGNGFGGFGNGVGFGGNWLGSITEIPVCKIVSFTHNALG